MKDLLKKRNTLKGRIKKLPKEKIKRSKTKLFEINFNRKEVANLTDAHKNAGLKQNHCL